MKKFLNIFIALSLLVSVFDIIDVSDITLADQPIFTSEELAANQDKDNIEDIYSSSFIMFDFSTNQTELVAFELNIRELNSILTNSTIYNKYISSLERPPRNV